MTAPTGSGRAMGKSRRRSKKGDDEPMTVAAPSDGGDDSESLWFGDNGDGGGHRGRGRERNGGADATQGAHRGSSQAEETDRAEGRDRRNSNRAGHHAADGKEVKAKKVARRGLRLKGKQLY